MNHRTAVPIALFCWLLASAPALAEDAEAAAESEHAETKPEGGEVVDANEDGASEADKRADEEKKTTAEIGMVFVGGIGILGVFLIAFTLIYGRRLRRQLKERREQTQPRDELWYLKTNQNRAAEPAGEEADE